MPVSPVDIITYLGGTVLALADNTLRRIHCLSLSLFLVGMTRVLVVVQEDMYLALLARAPPLYNPASAPISKDRSSARYPAYLGIPSSSFPTLFPGLDPDPSVPAPAPIHHRIILLVRRLPGPASQLDSSRFCYRACSARTTPRCP